MVSYDDFVTRNIGFITRQEQDKLVNSVVAVFGIGGLGGVISEILCRCGIGHLKLIDPDIIDISNLNRHVFGFRDNVGEKKTVVAENFLKKINPEIIIDKYERESKDNIEAILENVDCAILAADKIEACLEVSRKAYHLNVPLVEGWAIPTGNVRVYTNATPSLEDVYHLPTKGKMIEELSPAEIQQLNLHMLIALTGIEGVEDFYSEEAKTRVAQGVNPSFAPFVWFTAVLMAIETIKVLLQWGNIALAPDWSLYNPLNHNVPRQTA